MYETDPIDPNINCEKLPFIQEGKTYHDIREDIDVTVAETYGSEGGLMIRIHDGRSCSLAYATEYWKEV